MATRMRNILIVAAGVAALVKGDMVRDGVIAVDVGIDPVKDPETGKATYAVIQAEDEIAALGMVIGAGWMGARAMTSTASPSISTPRIRADRRTMAASRWAPPICRCRPAGPSPLTRPSTPWANWFGSTPKRRYWRAPFRPIGGW